MLANTLVSVATEVVKVALPPLANVTVEGLTEQLAFAGEPVQVKETDPLKPGVPETANWYAAV